jgi:glycosyltransferase involved in cell wall biosynthesis
VRLTEQIAEMTTLTDVALTRFMVLLFRSRKDLQRRFSLDSRFERSVFLAWFLASAKPEFQLAEPDVPKPNWRELDRKMLLKILWAASSFPKEKLDFDSRQDCLLIEAMLAAHPEKPMGLESALSAEAARFALEPDPELPNDLPVPICRLLSGLWYHRRDLRHHFMLEHREDRAGLVLWWLSEGMHELDTAPFLAAQIDVNKIAHLAWLHRHDLQAAFDINEEAGRTALQQWFSEYGREELALHKASIAKRIEVIPPRTGSVSKRAGLNIISSAKTGFGMSNHAFGTALAAKCVEVPTAIIDYQQVSADNAWKGCDVLNHCRYSINVAVCTPDDIGRPFAALGLKHFESAYNIFYGNWEFTQYSEDWTQIISMFDEVWAPSRFTYDALNSHINKPIYLMPLHVMPPRPAGLFDRKSFGFDPDEFVFLTMFDFYAGIGRKNPEAALKAFHLAFPKGTERTKLIIKTKNVHNQDYEDSLSWSSLCEGVKQDKRVIIIDEDYSAEKLADLVASANASVSLHRAEGFGLAIAESMLLAKPVIATAYSGNCEFMNRSNSCLVDFTLVDAPSSVSSNSRIAARWAEPDIGHAAWHMTQLATDPMKASSLGLAAQQFIQQNYGTAQVGAKIKARFEQLCQAAAPPSVRR